MNGFAAVAKRFTITYLPETGEYHVALPDSRRRGDRMGAHVHSAEAAAAWCERTWRIDRGIHT